jgi:hypothetical protein
VAKSVLFVHGLESGPRGRKARYLQSAGFTVVSDQMPCGRRQIARDPVVIASAAIAVGAIAIAGLREGGFGLVAAGAAVAVAAPFAAARLMRRVFRRSVGVQTRALAGHHVDVVVGSSFGGAVVVELLMRGDWSGPTLLLCPAHGLVAARARTAVPRLATLPDAVTSRIVVVHGRRDETVPIAHSEALVAGTRARLVTVDDDHWLSATATPEQLAAWIAMIET